MKHSWKKILISPKSTIIESLKVIDTQALRVALVVNENMELQGVVTDGDIRRGILSGVGLDSCVSEIMNRNPITACATTPKKELVKLMEKKSILSVPLVEKNIVVGLETLQHIFDVPEYDNPVFIMAGGFGTRLRPLTDNCPKPMLKIGNRPILETLILSFKNAGFKNFYISTHFMPEQIHGYFGNGSAFDVNIKYVHEDNPLGTGGALGLLPDDLPADLPLIMINGDVLTKVDFQRLLAFHNDKNADATMCVREYDYQIPYGVIEGDGNKITSMVEKPVQRFFVNAGIYVVSPRVIKSVPKNHRIDMPTLLEQHMNQRNNVLMFPIHEYWLDIGRMDDFNRAQVDIHTLGLN
ncbi:nucleotidyltransferase family protein [Shewanella basaltis]|uniref:nucleotidyltransferase family protein n=1 Tax=Shewanella basaltis TaxID=472183 RepID=UPI003AAF705F